jgi:hypothetical protein
MQAIILRVGSELIEALARARNAGDLAKMPGY